MELLNTILFIVLLIAFVIVLFGVGQRVYTRYFTKRTTDAMGRIAKDTIHIAIDQRSFFRLDFLSSELRGHKAEGPCVGIKGNHLYIDVVGRFATVEWRSEKVRVLFQTTFKRKPSYYQFNTTVTDVRRQGSNTILTLLVPSYLDPGQKRNSLRITPYKKSILGLGLWPMPKGMALPTSLEELPPSLLSYRPEKVETIMLDNLSAGGMRLTMDKHVPLSPEMPMEKGSRVLALLILEASEEGGKSLALWLVSKILMIQEPDEKVYNFGIRFSHWAMMERQKRPLAWFPLSENDSVAPLAAWVIRHHMEQTKML